MKNSTVTSAIRAMLWGSVVVVFVVCSLLIASCQQKHEVAQETETAMAPQQTRNLANNDNNAAILAGSEGAVVPTSAPEVGEQPPLPAEEPVQEPDEDIVTQERAGITYEVVAGDDLWGISRRFYHTHVYWNLLAGWNGIEDPGVLRIGQSLQIPSISEYPYQLYLVREGDNLYGISRVFYDTDRYWRDLAEANELINVNSIDAGTILKIPHAEEIAAEAAADSTWLAAE